MDEPLTTGRRRFLRTTQALAFLGLAAFTLHAALWRGDGLDGLFNDWVYNALVLCAAASCLIRAARVRSQRLPWLLMGIGLTLWLAAEITNTVYLSNLDLPPYPSIADAMWLAFYPTSYVALVLLVRGRMTGERRSSLWIDGLVAGITVAAIGEVLVFQPVIHTSGGTSLEVATDLAYPLCDLLLLSLVVGVFAMTGWRPGRAWTLIGAGLAAAVAADCIYAYQSAHGTYVEGTVLDALWPAATLLVGYAAWAPTGEAIQVRPSGWRVLVLPTLFAGTALGLLVYDHFHRVDDLAVVLATLTLVTVIVRTALTFGENLTMLTSSRREALTDSLTGLGNRRQLMTDLQREIDEASRERPRALILFDLDGFKRYNDNFGHPAGDSLLSRLGRNLAVAVDPWGRAYRLGGDEFCALVHAQSDEVHAVLEATSAALTEEGRGFSVSTSHGIVFIPEEARDPSIAMQIADQRLYGNKGARRRTAVGQQTRDVLMQVLYERQPALQARMHDVAQMAVAIGRKMFLLPEELDEMARAAELHDVGKMAVPDEILNKPGPLDAVERDFIHQHTLVGERILGAAPALAPVARLVRASHEKWDGSGYPDRLAGERIPLASRIIAVCDAYSAMTAERPFRAAVSTREALAELRRCAGTHFDPAVVEVLCAEVGARAAAAGAGAGAEDARAPEPEPALRGPEDRPDPTPLDPTFGPAPGEHLSPLGD
jgi:diguanylate cyclase (GGDEF)-like protein